MMVVLSQNWMSELCNYCVCDRGCGINQRCFSPVLVQKLTLLRRVRVDEQPRGRWIHAACSDELMMLICFDRAGWSCFVGTSFCL